MSSRHMLFFKRDRWEKAQEAAHKAKESISEWIGKLIDKATEETK